MFYDVVIKPSVKESKVSIYGYFRYLKRPNEKVNALRLSASKYLENSFEVSEFIKSLEKIIIDKDYYIIFDDSIVNENGQKVNGLVKCLDDKSIEIRLNPNARRLYLFVIIHELTHVIETSKMKDLVFDFISKDYRYSKLLKKYLKYESDGVFSEILADICGYLFGNIEFIKHLSIKNVGIFVSVYRKIVELSNRITGNTKSNLFIKNLRFIWEDAYRNNEINLDTEIKFSKIYNNDGTINRIKINENIFKNSNGKSINQTIKEYLELHIGEVYTIIESGQKVYLGKDLPGEYVYSKSAKSLPMSQKLAKGRAASNLQEIIENVTNRKWEKSKHGSHKTDAKYGFYKYDTTFSFDYNSQEKIYTGTILIRNDANGKKYLYDILNIKQQKTD